MRSILVIKPSSLGDVVHTLPAVSAIRAAFPEASITWLINPEWAPLLRGNPDIDHVHLFPRGDFRGFGSATSLLPWLRQTRRLRPDLAVDFQGLLRSALIARVSGAQQVYGLSDAREGSRFLYAKRARVTRGMHAVDRYMELARLVGADPQRPLHFPLPSGDPVRATDDGVPFVLLHPFARGRGKSMSSAAVRDFCRHVAPMRVVLVGQAQQPLEPEENCVDLTNATSLLQLIFLIRGARFVVSVDSGPMHIAAAVTDRLLSIHTWTDPRKVGPYRPEAWIWRNGEIRPMASFSRDERLPAGRPFRATDIPAVARLVQELSHSSL